MLHGDKYPTPDYGDEYWLVVCWECGRREEANKPPTALQRAAGFCSDCWKEDNPQWYDFKQALASQKRAMESEITLRQQKIDKIRNYLTAMKDVEQGRLTLENPRFPKLNLIDIEIPDWQQVADRQVKDKPQLG